MPLCGSRLAGTRAGRYSPAVIAAKQECQPSIEAGVRFYDMNFGITLSNRAVPLGLCSARDLLALADAVEGCPALDSVWCGDALFVNRTKTPSEPEQGRAFSRPYLSRKPASPLTLSRFATKC
jgi:hypothetical protein